MPVLETDGGPGFGPSLEGPGVSGDEETAPTFVKDRQDERPVNSGRRTGVENTKQSRNNKLKQSAS